MHGKVFENWIKGNSKLYSYSTSDRYRSSNTMFDIDKEDDIIRGIPTSIKSTKDEDPIGLADARNFWNSFDDAPYRILIGSYVQKGNVKKFTKIYEFFLEKIHRQIFFGDVTIDEIEIFHEGINKFKEGEHNEGRKWAKDQNILLKPRLGIIKLNPKIDSKTQRRLQCSVNLLDLSKNIQYKTVYTWKFGLHFLPLEIASHPRNFTDNTNILKS